MGKHNQFVHVLIDKRWHSNTVHVQCCRVTDCKTDHYQVVAKVRERETVSEQCRSMIWRDLILKSQMMWKSKNDIKLKSQIGV
jgi:hypothetical protein